MKTFEVKLKSSDVFIEVEADGFHFNDCTPTGELLLKFYKNADKFQLQKMKNAGIIMDDVDEVREEVMIIMTSSLEYIKKEELLEKIKE